MAARPADAGDAAPSILHLSRRAFLAGTVGGFAQAAVSHPFDTIKSRVASGAAPNMSVCIRRMLETEGPASFYKGVAPPICVMGAYNAALFSFRAAWTQMLFPAHDLRQPLPMAKSVGVSLLTAPFAVAVITPAEKVKVMLMLQSGPDAKYKGMLDAFGGIYRERGLRGLFQGYGATLGTRVVGLPFYFIGYDVSKAYLTPPGQEAPMWTFLASGVMAGFGFWITCYPFDYIKTQIQGPSAHLSMRQIVRDAVTQRGPLGLYKGLVPCLVRSAPANASVWFVVENMNKILESNGL